jgi:hypothetical protein
MTLRAELIGEAYLANGLRAQSLRTFCRKLLEAGHDPTERLEVYRGTTLSLLVRSIGEAARLRVTSNEQGTPVFGPANPSSEPQDSLPHSPPGPGAPARLSCTVACGGRSEPQQRARGFVFQGAGYLPLPEPAAGEASP